MPANPGDTSPGATRVGLYLPVTIAGRAISEVTIAPIRYDHIVRWGDGLIEGAQALLLELSGLKEHELRALAEPDSTRLMAVFIASLPADLRIEMAAGKPPRKAVAGDSGAEPPAFDPGGDGGDGLGIDFGERRNA